MKFNIIKLALIIMCCSGFMFSIQNEKAEQLPGLIAVNIGDSLYIFDNSDTSFIKFAINDKKYSYAGFRWFNKSNSLIGVEYFNDQSGGIGRGNLVCFNLTGEIIRTFHTGKIGEIPSYAFISNNDKRLLFSIEKKKNVRLNPLEGLNRTKTIYYLDIGSV